MSTHVALIIKVFVANMTSLPDRDPGNLFKLFPGTAVGKLSQCIKDQRAIASSLALPHSKPIPRRFAYSPSYPGANPGPPRMPVF